jgi:hypothetical protein
LAREAVALEAQKEFLSNSERSTKPDLPTLEQQRLEAIRDGKTQAVSDLNRAIEKCQEQSTPVLIRRADLERAIAIPSNRAERLKREQQAETERYKKLRESCRSYNLIWQWSKVFVVRPSRERERSEALNTTQKVIKVKLGLLELAEQLGNVSQACKVMG